MPELTLRQRKIASLAFVGVITIAFGVWAITYTPIFRADHVNVEGTRALGPRAVRTLAGIDGSTNVVHVDIDAIVARLTADPWIASASVERELPSTLTVRVVERRPIAIVAAMDEPTAVATDGTLLPATERQADLPTMHAAVGAPDEAQRVAAADLLSALDPVVMERVRDVTVGQDGTISMTLRDGTAVEAGTRGGESEKAADLRAILHWAATARQDLSSIDVSAPGAPSATLVNGSIVRP